MRAIADPMRVIIGPNHMEGLLGRAEKARGIIIFAHGSGSGRFSPRNNYVARRLEQAGFVTLLLDLLKPEEESDRRNVFDLPLLAARLHEAAQWARATAAISQLPIGYFGASTGGGAALLAAAQWPNEVSAVVSRGGRPDLAGRALSLVKAPTLLLVGGNDEVVEKLNRQAMRAILCQVDLQIIPGAGHLFEEPGTLDRVVELAIDWFRRHLDIAADQTTTLPFEDRQAAGRLLAEKVARLNLGSPLVLALPRGGVPVAYEVARELDCELDLLIVRKIGAPGNPEYGIGAIVDGDPPKILVNDDIVSQLGIKRSYLEREAAHELDELKRRRDRYLGGRRAARVEGRSVIVVDDGIATGGTMLSALRATRQRHPERLILAVPVAPADTVRALRRECDEIVCLAQPEPFYAVGAHYADFSQTSDEEVVQLIEAQDARYAKA